jgi:hypothetical protein
MTQLSFTLRASIMVLVMHFLGCLVWRTFLGGRVQVLVLVLDAALLPVAIGHSIAGVVRIEKLYWWTCPRLPYRARDCTFVPGSELSEFFSPMGQNAHGLELECERPSELEVIKISPTFLVCPPYRPWRETQDCKFYLFQFYALSSPIFHLLPSKP